MFSLKAKLLSQAILQAVSQLLVHRMRPVISAVISMNFSEQVLHQEYSLILQQEAATGML